MFFNRVDFFIGEGEGFAAIHLSHPRQRAERPVALVPPRSPGNLRHFRRGQPPFAPPVELAERGKGHMIEIKVQPHANRIGGDDVIDLARLKHRHLFVAGFG